MFSENTFIYFLFIFYRRLFRKQLFWIEDHSGQHLFRTNIHFEILNPKNEV